MANILLMDDAQDFCMLFSHYLQKMKLDCVSANTLESGLRELQSNDYDLVFLDVNLGNHSGLYHLPEILNAPGSPEVVIISSEGSGENAEAAITGGAKDFLVKPLPFIDLERCVSRCLRHREARSRFASKIVLQRDPIIGNSPKLLRAIQWVGIVARTKNNVLLLGETGTGKELFARAVHENSDRKNKPFTVVDCTNLPSSLAQSILFGHEKGTFTDAKESREGLFKQADSGTIFLDEIADLDMNIQKSLLRVLQEYSFRPLSSKKEIKSDFRLVAATNRDLPRMVQEGTFRQDLYYRLKSSLINLPPLRERTEDIPPLAIHYMKKACKELDIPQKHFSDDYLGALKNYSWPGNVRELVNTVTHSINNCFDSKTLHPYHLPKELRICHIKNNVKTSVATPLPDAASSLVRPPEAMPASSPARPLEALPVIEVSEESFPTLKEVRRRTVERMEVEYLIELMSRTQSEIKEACKISGLSRARLYELLQKHEIDYKRS